jgi:hypothetical protein
MKTILTKIAILIVSFIVGAGLGYYLKKPQTIEKQTEIEVVKKDVVTVVKEITKPDGSKEIVTTTTDRSQENRAKDKVIKTQPKRDWKISASVEKNDKREFYGLGIEKRIFDNIWVGVKANTDKSVGITVGVEF